MQFPLLNCRSITVVLSGSVYYIGGCNNFSLPLHWRWVHFQYSRPLGSFLSSRYQWFLYKIVFLFRWVFPTAVIPSISTAKLNLKFKKKQARDDKEIGKRKSTSYRCLPTGYSVTGNFYEIRISNIWVSVSFFMSVGVLCDLFPSVTRIPSMAPLSLGSYLARRAMWCDAWSFFRKNSSVELKPRFIKIGYLWWPSTCLWPFSYEGRFICKVAPPIP